MKEEVTSPLTARRTIAVSSFPSDLESESKTPGLDAMEDLIDRSTVDDDEQSFDETPSFHHGGSHFKSRTMSMISPQIEYDSGDEDELKENMSSKLKREQIQKTRFAKDVTNGTNGRKGSNEWTTTDLKATYFPSVRSEKESVFVDHGVFPSICTLSVLMGFDALTFSLSLSLFTHCIQRRVFWMMKNRKFRWWTHCDDLRPTTK